jgi:hypothetical protein
LHERKSPTSFAKLYGAYSRNLIFIIADRARARGIYKKRCRCGERLRAKAGGGESLARTRRLGGEPNVNFGSDLEESDL